MHSHRSAADKYVGARRHRSRSVHANRRLLMKIASMLLVAPLVLSGIVANAKDMDDQEFVTKAAEGGLAEVELGQTAADKASAADVKTFGQRMVTDHSKANDELKAAASKAGANVPTEP